MTGPQQAFFRFVASASPVGVRCPRNTHGPACPVPRGWDPDHSDQLYPYTLEQLAGRPEAPHRYAYPGVHEYEQTFHLWRVLRYEQDLTAAERDARLEALAACILSHAPGRLT